QEGPLDAAVGTGDGIVRRAAVPPRLGVEGLHHGLERRLVSAAVDALRPDAGQRLRDRAVVDAVAVDVDGRDRRDVVDAAVLEVNDQVAVERLDARRGTYGRAGLLVDRRVDLLEPGEAIEPLRARRGHRRPHLGLMLREWLA